MVSICLLSVLLFELIGLFVGAIILHVLQACAAAVLAIFALFTFATREKLFPSGFYILGANGFVHETKVVLDHCIIHVIDNSDGVFRVRRKGADLTPMTVLLLGLEFLYIINMGNLFIVVKKHTSS